MIRPLTLTATALLLLGATTARAADPKLETDDQKTVYALGLALSESLKPYELTAEELDLLKAGLTDGIQKTPPKVELKDYQMKIREFGQKRQQAAADVEKKDSAAFLEKMAKEKGAQKTESGLIYIETQAGSGENPKATDTVKVHYHGTLRDGTVFDSSVERGQPATFPLNRVVKCWTEGVQKMKVGGKAKLICPPDLAYGDRGAPPKIKGGSALVFEVELISIEPAATPKPAMGHP